MSRTQTLWLVWILGTLLVGGVLLTRLYVAGDRSAMLIGETTGVHHQFETACESCHAAGPFSTAKEADKALNKACIACHADELAESDDSHPTKKFTNPRMASLWVKVDARMCTSCHVEHLPEITRPGAVTLAMDYCVACHSEGDRDVRVNRPSHAGLGFETCATAGCHNFHDNRALYEDFLVKHADQPWLKEAPVLALAAQRRGGGDDGARDAAAMEAYLAKAVAPDHALTAEALEGWAGSAHAANDIGCAACHAPGAETEAAVLAGWVEKPTLESCGECHKSEQRSFSLGRHGMRSHPGIAKPRKPAEQLEALGLTVDDDTLIAALAAYLEDPAPPQRMTVAEARLPMKFEAHGSGLDCATCHKPHEQDTRRAAVESCLGCHDDQHSTAYLGSPHHALWTRELAGEGPAGSGVSCATCHMPTEEVGGEIVVNHNQNEGLRPNEKMIRPVCMSCHGLGFAIDALADPDLVARNFNGSPAAHVESIDWAVRRVRATDASANQ